jgi:hypothetical protein
MAVAVAYDVHESWIAGRFTAALHRGNCIYCNYGTGQVIGSYLCRGEWHGPYKKRSQAIAKLASLTSIVARASCQYTL